MSLIFSQVCDSPRLHKGKPVITLESSDLCSAAASVTPDQPAAATAATTTTSTPRATAAQHHSVVTWTWQQAFTRIVEWSHDSGSEVRGEGSLVGSHASPNDPTPTAERHDNTTIIVTTQTHRTTEAIPETSETIKPWLVTDAAMASTSSWVNDQVGVDQRRDADAVRAPGVFCFWLFAGSVMLCFASAACTLVTLARFIIWYRTVFDPLSEMMRGGGREGGRLLTCSRRTEVLELYRSVLYVSREGERATEREDGGTERLSVTLEPTGGGGRETRGEGGGGAERGVYRKTIFRLFSKQEEIDGWWDVMEDYQVTAEDRGKRGGEGRVDGGGAVAKKRYSVILREEREEAGGGREELDWVVGGWQVRNGDEVRGEENRSSWGEWLGHYLPSMPWGVTTPPEGEAAK